MRLDRQARAPLCRALPSSEVFGLFFPILTAMGNHATVLSREMRPYNLHLKC